MATQEARKIAPGLCPGPHPRGAPIMCAKRANYRGGSAPCPRRPSGVDQRKAFGILKGARGAHFLCALRQIMGKRPPCFNSARGEYYTITLYIFQIIRVKKDDVFGLPPLNGLVYM